MKYLNDELKPGSWYVSEGFVVARSDDTQDAIAKMVCHNIGADRMILAGPFPTKEEAKARALSFGPPLVTPYVWQYPVV